MASQRFRLAYSFDDPSVSDGYRTAGSSLDLRSYANNYPDDASLVAITKTYSDVRTLTNATFPYVLSSLADGTAFAHVMGIVLEILSPIGTVGTGTVGPGATHGWTVGMGGQVLIRPNGLVALQWPESPPVVASGTNDQIDISVTGTLQFLLSIVGN